MKRAHLLIPTIALLIAACGTTETTTTTSAAKQPAQGGGSTGSLAPTATNARWSDPTAWPTGNIPAEGDAVTIPAGKSMLLDVSPPRLANLTIEGALVFDQRDLTLQADWIMLHGGHLEIGSELKPFQHRATISLTDATPGENVMNMGDKFIASMMNGVIEIHGQPRLSWTKLAQSAPAGANSITLTDTPDWRQGDQIVLASTDYDHRQAEVLTVRSVTKRTVTFNETLKYPHYGALQTIAGRTLDERAEVGLLTRNVLIQGEATSSATGMGGNIMVMSGSQARIENAELTRMGQKNVLRRYPIHYHMLGSAATSYVRGNSLHGLFNRCVTIHGTNDLRVERNVAYGTLGHCVFLEDGAETGNIIERNLVLGVRKPAEGEALLPSDRTHPGATAYWITNPANTVRDNVAAGGDGTGFWYALPPQPLGLSSPANTPANAGIYPRRTPLTAFSGNTAHSLGSTGLFVDSGPKDDTGVTVATNYDPRVNPADPKSAPVTAVFDTFTAYKNRDSAVWLRGRNHVLRNAVMADNAIGVTFASSASTLEGGIVIGESANLGKPPSWEKTGLDGRSLPRPWDAAFPIRGFQFYDGDVKTVGTTYANFTPNTLRPASGLAYLRRNSFPLTPHNAADNVTFVNANRVYLENPQADRDGDKAAVFRDTTGSVTGTAGRSVTANAPLLFDATCTRREEWNAFVCDKPYARLWLDDVNAASVSDLTITRVADGASQVFVGVPDTRKAKYATVWTGGHYALAYASGVPARLRVGITDRAPGDSVRLSVPYATNPSIYRDWWIDNRNRLKQVDVTQLDATTGDSYAWDGSTLHVKLVVKTGATAATLDICQTDLCQ